MNELKTVRTPEVVAAEIRTFTASMLNNIIEIGRRMAEAKEMLPYGEFGTWIREKTGYSVSTANNFMRLFDEYADAQGSLFGAELECQTFGKLSYTKALALLALPPAEREEFVIENDVEAMSTRQLQQAIRERDAARQEAEGATLQIGALERARDKVQNELEEARKKESAAQAELTKAKTQLQEARQKVKTAEEKGALTVRAEAEKAKAEAELLKAEAERLQKQLAMSDPATTEFKVHFATAQNELAACRSALVNAPAEAQGKLRAAMAALGKTLID